MGRAVRLAARMEGVLAEAVWRVFEGRMLERTWKSFPHYLWSENLVFTASARISMRRRCTGHMMAAVLCWECAPVQGPTMQHE